jgi:hypothetical protein
MATRLKVLDVGRAEPGEVVPAGYKPVEVGGIDLDAQRKPAGETY